MSWTILEWQDHVSLYWSINMRVKMNYCSILCNICVEECQCVTSLWQLSKQLRRHLHHHQILQFRHCLILWKLHYLSAFTDDPNGCKCGNCSETVCVASGARRWKWALWVNIFLIFFKFGTVLVTSYQIVSVQYFFSLEHTVLRPRESLLLENVPYCDQPRKKSWQTILYHRHKKTVIHYHPSAI